VTSRRVLHGACLAARVADYCSCCAPGLLAGAYIAGEHTIKPVVQACLVYCTVCEMLSERSRIRCCGRVPCTLELNVDILLSVLKKSRRQSKSTD